MKTIILTKNQIWQLATIIQQYEVDSVKIHIDHSSGIGAIMKVEFENEKEPIDITDVASW